MCIARIMNEHGQNVYRACLYFCIFAKVKFHALNVVTRLSDWTPNGDCSGIHKSPVNSKDPPRVAPLNISRLKNA